MTSGDCNQIWLPAPSRLEIARPKIRMSSLSAASFLPHIDTKR